MLEEAAADHLNTSKLIRISYNEDSGKLSALELYKNSTHGFVHIRQFKALICDIGNERKNFLGLF
jgi:hypothetical protein